MSSAVLGIHDE